MNRLYPIINTIRNNLTPTTKLVDAPYVLNPTPILYKLNSFEISNDIFKGAVYLKTEFFKNDYISAYYILWKPNSISHVHGHSPLGCYFKPLMDGLVEHRYKEVNKYLQYIEENKCLTTKSYFIDDSKYFHSMENKCNNVIPSIHIYEKDA